MSVSMIVILLLSLVILAETTNLPEEWHQQIRQYCSAFERNPHPPIQIVTVPPDSQPTSNAKGFLIPTCVLWSPLEQYPANYICPKCTITVTNAELRPVRWQDGSNPQSSPRKIHGIDGPVFVVGRVYKCTSGHEVLAYHPELLKQVPVQEAIPFSLWHRTSFTTDLLQLVHSLVLAGTTINAISESLQGNRRRVYFNMKHLYHSLHSYLNAPEMPFPSLDEYEQVLGVEFAPSRHSVGAIFLASFWKKEKLYVNAMRRTMVDKDDGWLCCDHTFASVRELAI